MKKVILIFAAATLLASCETIEKVNNEPNQVQIGWGGESRHNPTLYHVIKTEDKCDGTIVYVKHEKTKKVYQFIMSIPNGNYHEGIEKGDRLALNVVDSFKLGKEMHLKVKEIGKLMIH